MSQTEITRFFYDITFALNKRFEVLAVFFVPSLSLCVLLLAKD